MIRAWTLAIRYVAAPCDVHGALTLECGGHVVAVITATDEYMVHVLQQSQAQIQRLVVELLRPPSTTLAVAPTEDTELNERVVILSVCLGLSVLAACICVVCVARLWRKVNGSRHVPKSIESPIPVYPEDYTMPILSNNQTIVSNRAFDASDSLEFVQRSTRHAAQPEPDADNTPGRCKLENYIDLTQSLQTASEMALKRRGEYLNLTGPMPEALETEGSIGPAFLGARASSYGVADDHAHVAKLHMDSPSFHKCTHLDHALSNFSMGLAAPQRRDIFPQTEHGIEVQRHRTNCLVDSAFDIMSPARAASGFVNADNYSDDTTASTTMPRPSMTHLVPMHNLSRYSDPMHSLPRYSDPMHSLPCYSEVEQEDSNRQGYFLSLYSSL